MWNNYGTFILHYIHNLPVFLHEMIVPYQPSILSKMIQSTNKPLLIKSGFLQFFDLLVQFKDEGVSLLQQCLEASLSVHHSCQFTLGVSKKTSNNRKINIVWLTLPTTKSCTSLLFNHGYIFGYELGQYKLIPSQNLLIYIHLSRRN